MDSDGLFSSTSQQRLSRLSADRDSALGADITDSRWVWLVSTSCYTTLPESMFICSSGRGVVAFSVLANVGTGFEAKYLYGN